MKNDVFLRLDFISLEFFLYKFLNKLIFFIEFYFIKLN